MNNLKIHTNNPIIRLVCGFFILNIFLIMELNAADSRVFHAIGTGQIRRDQVERARRDAVLDGLKEAVNQAVIELIPIENMIHNFSGISQTVEPKIRNFIKSYKVLAEYKTDNEYKVLIQTTVSEGLLKKELIHEIRSVSAADRLPKVLLLIAEHQLDLDKPIFRWEYKRDSSLYSYAEAEIQRVLTEKGFEVILYQASRLEGEEAKAVFLPQTTNLTVGQAVQAGRQFEADVVILGKASAHQTLNVMDDNTRTYHSVITANAYLVDTEEEIGFSLQTEIILHEDSVEGVKQSLTKVSLRASEELSLNIISFWNQKERDKSSVELIVGGKAYLRNFVQFRKKMEEMPEIREVNLTEMKSNEALLSVLYNGSSREFAAQLMKITFDNFGINIYQIADNQLRIELTTSP